MSRVEYWELSKVSANIVVAIFRVYMYFWLILVVLCRAESGRSIGCNVAIWRSGIAGWLL
jgi:hypothetical protein